MLFYIFSVEFRVGNESSFLRNPLCNWKNGLGTVEAVTTVALCETVARYVTISSVGSTKLTLCAVNVLAKSAKNPVNCPDPESTENPGEMHLIGNRCYMRFPEVISHENPLVY